MTRFLLCLSLLLVTTAAVADTMLPVATVNNAAGGGQVYSVSLQILVAMTLLTLLPAALMMTTSFTRIIIVLAILRQALGTAQTPPNQILVGLALFLTLFVMAPVFERANQEALQPYLDDRLAPAAALERAAAPFKTFMLAQTRDADSALYARLAAKDENEAPEQASFPVITAAFITSELKTAFQIGFLIFIPFLIIDLVVASVLMSMGMMMLSPLTVSFPFKLMLFVLVDGWGLVMGTLASSFY